MQFIEAMVDILTLGVALAGIYIAYQIGYQNGFRETLEAFEEFERRKESQK